MLDLSIIVTVFQAEKYVRACLLSLLFQNIENYEHYFTQYPQIPEEEIPKVNDVSKFMSTEISEDAGVDDFESFIKESIDPVMPIGMTFEDWYNKAKEIDNISEKEAVDIADTATSYLNKDLKDRETYE